MRLGVLGSSESWYVSDLRRAANRVHGVQIQVAPFSKIAVVADRGRPEIQVRADDVNLNALDAVLVRTMAPGSLEQVVFRMDALAVLERQGVVVMNRPKAIEASVDKFLSTARLRQAGLNTPTTAACQDFDSAMNAFEDFGGDVVLKPLFGGEGRGLMRLHDQGLAHRTFKTLLQLNAVFYLQPFISHDSDIRLLRIGERVFAMRRRNNSDWRTNLSQGGVAEPMQITSQLSALAHQACEAVGAEFAGVDVISGPDQEPMILEVNAVPGWRGMQKVQEADIADTALDFLRRCVAAKADGSG